MSRIRRLRGSGRKQRPETSQEPETAVDPDGAEATAEDSSESEVGAVQAGTEATAEDSSESEVGADQAGTEATAEDSSESEVGADQAGAEATAEDSPGTEDTAGTEESPGTEDSPEIEESQESEAAAVVERGPSRVGRRWLAGISAALLLLAGGVGTGGYFALRAHLQSQAQARSNTAALQVAKDCVAATQAPDPSTMSASEQKIIDCGTDQFRSQALLYTSVFVQAYQAANVHVQVSDMRAAVERNNPDGTVDILVALRVKVANDQAQAQETGYRLRVRMAFSEGQYRISRLDQVTK
ncbi:MAG: Mce protein [Mycobacterium sp.]|nr:Mce protein [Mycobacterium sp.]MBW0016330.1 Mce protein [Mycobacterium sp.]